MVKEVYHRSPIWVTFLMAVVCILTPTKLTVSNLYSNVTELKQFLGYTSKALLTLQHLSSQKSILFHGLMTAVKPFHY